MGNSSAMANQPTMSKTMTNHTTVGESMANTSDSCGEGSSAVVRDFSNISINVVGVVVDVLDPSVGEVDGVVALPGSGAIVRLLGVKTRSRVVVSHSILVGVGRDLVGVDRHSVGNSMAYYGMADSNAMAMANTHSMAKANTMTNSSKQLSGGGSHNSRDGNESLRMKYQDQLLKICTPAC